MQIHIFKGLVAGFILAGGFGLPAQAQTGGNLPPLVSLTIPTNGQVFAGPTNITIAATASDPDGRVLRVEFFSGGVKIREDTSSPYTIVWSNITDGAYVLTAMATDTNLAQTTSAPVNILVVDRAPLAIAGLAAKATEVTVIYSKRVTAESALDRNHYAISGGVAIQSVAFASGSETAVVLQVSALTPGTAYTLTVNDVRDYGGKAIPAGTQVQFSVSDYVSQNIGNPVLNGSAMAAGNGFAVLGAGTNIFGNADQFFYQHRQVTGDFDVQVRLDGLSAADIWSKAGLMARESLAAISRHASIFATPSISGAFFAFRPTMGGQTTNTGALPVNYPNTWLRLKRAGAVFSGYAGFDGHNWMQLGTVTLTAPTNTFYLGLAVAGLSTNQAAKAEFRDYGVAAGGAVGNIVFDREPLGPSSRRTGLVISEIMYRPRGAAGDRLEFIELFNSQPFFENVGRYRLSGAIDYTFPVGTVIPAGGFLVVARDPGAIQSFYGISGVLGPWQGASTNGLPGGEGQVRLHDNADSVLLEVNYSGRPPWPVAADGAGHSLVLARPSYGEGDVRAWAASDAIGGSPGRPEPFGTDPLGSVVINEFLASSQAPARDFLELYNHSSQEVDLSGAWLTDEAATNKFRIPAGTRIGPRGFAVFVLDDTTTGFALSSSGERIFLVNSNQTRVLDAVDFGPQSPGISTGRIPDGAPSFYRLAAPSPEGSNHGGMLQDPIVINEIMYNPISGDANDEYVELYNRGTNAVDVSGWRFLDGITFTIPANTVIGANGYLVVARDAERMRKNYANLGPTNLVGNFSGSLANGGEHIALGMPRLEYGTVGGKTVTNTVYVLVNEVTYSDGGRWGLWSDGGGSSLELKDPHSDNRQSANWADSDESDKGIWTNIELTGTLGETLGSPVNDQLLITLLGIGECLVDEVAVIGSQGTNLVRNSGFELGATNWVLQGSHDQSTIENTGYAGNRSLHLRAAWRGDNGGNRVRTTPLAALASGTVTLRAKAKWLRGWPDLLLRLHGGAFEAGGRMQLQPNLGTPGARNSRAITNAGPAVYDVAHTPALPAANEPVVVTARAGDPDGPVQVNLKYRVEPATTFTTLSMKDDGTGGDRVAGDGIYSATLAGRTTNTVAFYVEAVDGLGAANTFPQLVFPTAPLVRVFPYDALARLCVVKWGERQMTGNLGEYHVWLTSENTTRWRNRRPVLNNTPLDATFVYNNYRIIYNMRPMFAGSPWHRGQMTAGPDGGNRTDYSINFPEDDMFLGATDAVWGNPGNPGGSTTTDLSAQSEQTSYLIFKELGIYYNYRRYVHIFVNGTQRSITTDRPGNFIMEDCQQPNSDTIAQWFPDDTDGQLYKIEDWFEFSDNGDDFTTNNDADLSRRQMTTNGVPTLHTGAYRFMWRKRSVGAGENANDYATFFALLEAVSPTTRTDAPIDMGMISQIMDYEQWMRIFACQHTVGNWDSYGYDRGKNAYTYKPQFGRFVQWTWDIDFTMGIGGNDATTDVFGTTDPRIQAMWRTPEIVRAYWRAFSDIINGPLNRSYLDPILDAKAAALAANGINFDPGFVNTIKNFTTARRNYLSGRLTALTNAAFSVTGTNSFTSSSNVVTLRGTAPIPVKDILINGVAYPVLWAGTTPGGVTNWSVRLALDAGTNRFTIQGYDLRGNLLSNTVRTVTINHTGTPPDPRGEIVLHEIMAQPALPDASFIELYNRSTNTYDLSGWRLDGVSYTFPAGTLMAGGQYLVLAKSWVAYSAAYGGVAPIFDEFSGQLNPAGETLTLIRPGDTPETNLIVDKVRYETSLPWPELAASGASLQLMDNAEDNARASNWRAGDGWQLLTRTGRLTTGTGSSVQLATNLLIWLRQPGEVYLDDIALVPAAGGANLVSNGDFESDLGEAWTIPANYQGSEIVSGRSRSGHRSLRFNGLASTGQITNSLSLKIAGPIQTNVDYTLSLWWRLGTNLVDLNARVLPMNTLSTNVLTRLLLQTPGVANHGTQTLPVYDPVWLNELQAQNLSGIIDQAGEHEPWIELYNAGTTTVNLEGYYLADNYTNRLTQWAFPTGATLAPGEFRIIIADGEPDETTAIQWHANFRLNPGSGTVALVRLVEGEPQITDYLTYTALKAGQSYGDAPDGQPFDRQDFAASTPGASNLAPPPSVFINEWMAANTSISNIADPADGRYDDWFELFNPGPNSADLTGYYLTDDPTNPDAYIIPAGYIIPPGGFLLVWADDETVQNRPDRPDLHVNFRLSQAGESIRLTAPNGTVIDSVTFGGQASNVSEGRFPDATGPVYALTRPTPGAHNVLGNITPAPEFSSVSVLSGNIVSFAFSTVSGRTYRVVYKDALNEPDWKPLVEDQPGTGAVLTINDPIGGHTQRFYRVFVVE